MKGGSAVDTKSTRRGSARDTDALFGKTVCRMAGLSAKQKELDAMGLSSTVKISPRVPGGSAMKTGSAMEMGRASGDAEANMVEQERLLFKIKTNTASREEIDRFKMLNTQMQEQSEVAQTTKRKDMTDLRNMVTKKESEMRLAVKDRQIQSVIRQAALAETVDLSFVIDATGSMTSYIEGVKKYIRSIVREVKRTHPGLSLRMAVVAYRDVSDRNRFEVLDFTSSVEGSSVSSPALKPLGGTTLLRTWLVA